MFANDRKEHELLLKEIEASPGFVGAPKRRELMWYLFLHPEGVRGKDLLGPLGVADEVTVRQTVKKLHDALIAYANSNAGKQQNWRCELPKGKYQLNFIRITQATRVFWRAHLESHSEVIVVCNELMFYQDFANNKIIRYTDVNPEESLGKEQKLDSLRHYHPDALKGNPRLEPVYLYLVTAEVESADRLSDWFEQHSGRNAARKISRQEIGDDVLGSSPILLGTTRTNRFVRNFLKLAKAEAGHLSYGFSDKFGELRIRDLRKFPQEVTNLKQCGTEIQWAGNAATIKSRIESEGYAFGCVWRIRLPGGLGRPVTIIGSDSTLAIQQIVTVLVDERQMAGVFARMKWPVGVSLPPSFELLFAVQIEPGSVQFKAGEAELIGWRTYEYGVSR